MISGLSSISLWNETYSHFPVIIIIPRLSTYYDLLGKKVRKCLIIHSSLRTSVIRQPSPCLDSVHLLHAKGLKLNFRRLTTEDERPLLRPLKTNKPLATNRDMFVRFALFSNKILSSRSYKKAFCDFCGIRFFKKPFKLLRSQNFAWQQILTFFGH